MSLISIAYFFMRDGTDGADFFAGHAGNVAGRIDSDGIEGTDKAGLLRTHRHTGAAIDTGIPADMELDDFSFSHG
jgi:hypothetical protein